MKRSEEEHVGRESQSTGSGIGIAVGKVDEVVEEGISEDVSGNVEPVELASDVGGVSVEDDSVELDVISSVVELMNSVEVDSVSTIVDSIVLETSVELSVEDASVLALDSLELEVSSDVVVISVVTSVVGSGVVVVSPL